MSGNPGDVGDPGDHCVGVLLFPFLTMEALHCLGNNREGRGARETCEASQTIFYFWVQWYSGTVAVTHSLHYYGAVFVVGTLHLASNCS